MTTTFPPLDVSGQFVSFVVGIKGVPPNEATGFCCCGIQSSTSGYLGDSGMQNGATRGFATAIGNTLYTTPNPNEGSFTYEYCLTRFDGTEGPPILIAGSMIVIGKDLQMVAEGTVGSPGLQALRYGYIVGVGCFPIGFDNDTIAANPQIDWFGDAEQFISNFLDFETLKVKKGGIFGEDFLGVKPTMYWDTRFPFGARVGAICSMGSEVQSSSVLAERLTYSESANADIHFASNLPKNP